MKLQVRLIDPAFLTTTHLEYELDDIPIYGMIIILEKYIHGKTELWKKN
jgi:hypothetical protein